MKKRFKASIAAVILGLTFAGGYYAGKKEDIGHELYDKLKSEYDRVYLDLTVSLKHTEDERVRLSAALHDLDRDYKILHDSLNHLPKIIVYRDKIKNLSVKELEDLMKSEYLKSIE